MNITSTLKYVQPNVMKVLFLSLKLKVSELKERAARKESKGTLDMLSICPLELGGYCNQET